MELLGDLIEEWALTLGNVVESSRVVYLRGVRQFASWLERAHPALDEPGQITGLHVHEWLR